MAEMNVRDWRHEGMISRPRDIPVEEVAKTMEIESLRSQRVIFTPWAFFRLPIWQNTQAIRFFTGKILKETTSTKFSTRKEIPLHPPLAKGERGGFADWAIHKQCKFQICLVSFLRRQSPGGTIAVRNHLWRYPRFSSRRATSPRNCQVSLRQVR